MKLHDAPIGTFAPAIMGGAWVRTKYGWTWNGHRPNPGSTFLRPGGDWDGRLITRDEYERPFRALEGQS